MTNIYQDETYSQNNPTWHSEDSAWKADHIFDLLVSNSLQPKTIAEIGCGAGLILKELSTKLPSSIFYGYDISPVALSLCNNIKHEKLNFELRDILSQEEKESSIPYFDIVMAIDVMEHIEDNFSFLRKLHKKGKYKILHIPLELSVSSVLRPHSLIHARKTVGHIHYFTRETALATLEDCGYKIMDSFYTCSAAELPTHLWKRKLAKLPRKLLFTLNQNWAARLVGGFSLLVLAE